MRKLLISLCLAVCICVISGKEILAGNYGVGGIYKLCDFPTQSYYGVKGYALIEPNGLAQTAGGTWTIIYHTHANASKYGIETIVKYTDSYITLPRAYWSHEQTNYYNHIEPDNTGFWNSQSISVGDAAGNIESSFEPYLTTLSLEGRNYKALYFDDISTYDSGEGRWHEHVRIKNFNTQTMDVISHVSWDGTSSSNSASSTGGGHALWCGTFEMFNVDPYAYNNAKAGGNYYMSVFHNGQWKASGTVSVMRTYDGSTNTTMCGYSYPAGNSHFTCFNNTPNAGFWIATVP